MIRAAAACAALVAWGAAPLAGAVLPVPAVTPQAPRFGEITLAGTTVLWDGDERVLGVSQVLAADRLPDGTYGTARVVSTYERNAFIADGAADAEGRAVVALVESAPGAEGSVVRVVDVVPGGAITGRDLERARKAAVSVGARVAVNPRGDAVVVWERWSERAGTSSLMLARRPAGRAVWTAPRALAAYPARETRLAPALGVDAAGRFTVAWHRDGVVAVTGTVAAGAGVPRRLGPGGSSGVAVAAAADRALVVWARPGAAGDTPVAALRRAGGRLGTARPIDAARRGWTVDRVAAAAGAEGTLSAAWTLGAGAAVAHRAAIAAPGGRLGAVRVVTRFNRRPVGVSPFGTAVGPDGTVAVAWRQSGRVEVALAPPSQPFGAPIVLGSSSAEGSGDVSGAERGALVAWSGGGRVRISTATAPPS